MKNGDLVYRNDQYYVPEEDEGKIFLVTSNPFMINGDLVVTLEGKEGFYLVDGLTVVKEYTTPWRNHDNSHNRH